MRFDDDAPMLGGQRLTGWELREIFERVRQRKALLAIPIAVKLVRDAVHDLATKSDHCGVSPRNLFVTADGSMRVLDICLTGRRSTDPRLRMAAHGYLAPEQIDGGIIDQRTDIFAMGAVLYELLAGRPLFVRGSAEQMLASLRTAEIPAPVRSGEHIDPTLLGVVARMSQRAPEHRYQTPADVERDLNACLAALGPPKNADVADVMARLIGASPMSRWVDDLVDPRRPRAHRPQRRRRNQPVITTVATLAICGATIAAYVVQRHWPQAPSVVRGAAQQPTSPVLAPETTTPREPAAAADPAKTSRADAPVYERMIALPAIAQAPTAPPKPRHLPTPTTTKSQTAAKHVDPATGHLSLDAKPLANVYLGDRLLGATPLVERELPSGLTPLRLVDPITGHEQTVVIDIPSGGDVHRLIKAE